ncbi:MAG: hypothetical protein Q9196_006763 [Gyalolechia fulgens]
MHTFSRRHRLPLAHVAHRLTTRTQVTRRAPPFFNPTAFRDVSTSSYFQRLGMRGYENLVTQHPRSRFPVGKYYLPIHRSMSTSDHKDLDDNEGEEASAHLEDDDDGESNNLNEYPSFMFDGSEPRVHDVVIKRPGENQDWESVRTILTQHIDSHGRVRRLWVPIAGSEPTAEELASQWIKSDPKSSSDLTLKDQTGDLFRSPDADRAQEGYTVTEKTGPEGRRLWREVLPAGFHSDVEEEMMWEEVSEEWDWRLHI